MERPKLSRPAAQLKAWIDAYRHTHGIDPSVPEIVFATGTEPKTVRQKLREIALSEGRGRPARRRMEPPRTIPPTRSREERDALVASCMDLVHWAVRQQPHDILRRIGGTEEAVSIGYLALINAAIWWDANRAIRFTTYATTAIKRAIYEACDRAMPRRRRVCPKVLDTLSDRVEDVDLVEVAEERIRLRLAIWLLPPRSRKVVREVALRGRSTKAVSRELGIGRSSVISLLHAGVRRLGAILRRNG